MSSIVKEDLLNQRTLLLEGDVPQYAGETSMMNDTIARQNIASQMVGVHIYGYLTPLINELANMESGIVEDIPMGYQDWETHARQLVFEAGVGQLTDAYLDIVGDHPEDNGIPPEEVGDALLEIAVENGNWEQLAKVLDGEDTEPDSIEALEFWLVSPWLGIKLKGRGEMINQDWFGLCVWGRSCSGQAIKLDNVIQEIATQYPNAY